MFLQHKGVHIFYTDTGEGQPLVLLHGFLENSSMWEAFIPEISKKNRVICIDLLGHGQTECLGYVHTMELMAEAVDAVLQHLQVYKPIMIGHSMGGYVALAFAERNPEALLKLCLMNSTAQEDSTERKENRERAINAVKQNHQLFINMAISNLFRPKNRIIFAEAIKAIKKEALRTPLQGIIAALEGMKIRKNREAIMKNGSFKTMMMISKKDPVLDYAIVMEEAKRNEAKVVEFSDGHMSYIENESLFFQSIMYFIE
ncbi:alpha/beta fold hydrolase [Changchengzhania lutea]|uniref:alpha/beta fold hydrolase n=1 Tax=Changchengzhania lutea TaxID=2049305 RepID=UPI00115E5FD3|nr:alpha/beta hydrolase [Changchengzhania lutea]